MHIQIENLSRRYGRSRLALDEVTTEFAGGMTGLLGDNGAGKSTLIRILAGTLPATSGRVLVDGVPVTSTADRRAVKSRLGYLPQDFTPYPTLTAFEFLDYVGVLKGMTSASTRRASANRLLDAVGLGAESERRLGGFSGGMRRRVGIAQALMGDPDLVIVDEPTAGLDPQERVRFRSILATLEGRRTVILSTHILDDVAQTCPFVCVLASGSVNYSGPTAGLVDHAEGRTWRCITDGPPPPGMVISNASAVDGGTAYRAIGDDPPAGAEALEPTLEDGYMALMGRTAP